MRSAPQQSRNAGRTRAVAVASTVLMCAAGCASARSVGPADGGNVAGGSSSPPPAPAAAAVSAPAGPPALLHTAMYQPIVGACRASLRPDRAVIVGGMSVSGIRPTETAARLQRQLDALRALADEVGGDLRMIERVRAARAPNSRQRHDGDEGREPYVVVQRFELELAVGGDIDRALERTLQTGLDRYGSDAGIDPQPGASRPLVVYRFSEIDAQLRASHAGCRHDAVRSWCEARAGREPGTAAAACAATLESAQHLSTERLVFRSRPVTLANGSVEAVQLAWPFAGAEGLQLGGDAELVLSGEIALRLAPGRQ